MSTVFLNYAGPFGRETVEEIDSAEFADRKALRAELRHRIACYRGLGMAVYQSSRPCRNWND